MYKDCINGRVSHDKRIYRFPLSTDARQNIWIRNSGKFMYIRQFLIHKYTLVAIFSAEQNVCMQQKLNVQKIIISQYGPADSLSARFVQCM